MTRYAAVLFDWDGTVMDSTYSIASSIQLASADLQLPVPSIQQASWVIGLSLESALYRAVPDLTAEQMPLFLERYRYHFMQRDPHIKLFDGILPFMGELRGRQIALGVATGKSRQGLDRVLQQVKLSTFFDATRCADETRSKPDPEMLHQLLAELMLEPEQVLMVGDTVHDIHMAANAGMDSVAVTYGAHDPQTLAKAEPTVMVDNVAQMRDWVLARI
ncbi:HAD family hydrolase [Alcaligenes aquatilis]|jgi:phosphoglycolate phosphatase|uniref:phosphoglycolate phosphatase n=2 Tax=Alcaligenes TaxID=507 RepID=A0AB33CVT7_ALCFA|nr:MULTISPECIES: HAD-IA family hydrolase [Alcaligenes]ASR90324.1 HAD family hydrolase [Alcaligenes faecalis]AWG35085.1 HAD family hydrolase [Alcaligenes aquatilis]MCC9161963.1 HAD-IA family hydrolase [Alcaligenes sp. MMA]MCH4224667.1 HAD-IA family hydrolase [Alcaligenes faecalis]QXR34863.1 HAD-IA family hydrolase [Alcaligenes aquatilis]